jgi:hypothetical protein
VEAKANAPEFCSPPTTASSASREKIVKALDVTKGRLGVHRFYSWHGTYYQYANRLVVLDLLRRHGVDAHLAFVYFLGDRFPDGTACPSSVEDWEALIEARRLTLGLPVNHALSPYDHHVFLPVG